MSVLAKELIAQLMFGKQTVLAEQQFSELDNMVVSNVGAVSNTTNSLQICSSFYGMNVICGKFHRHANSCKNTNKSQNETSPLKTRWSWSLKIHLFYMSVVYIEDNDHIILGKVLTALCVKEELSTQPTQTWMQMWESSRTYLTDNLNNTFKYSVISNHSTSADLSSPCVPHTLVV